MSEPFEFIPDGNRRVVVHTLEAGEKYTQTKNGVKGSLVINRPCLVDFEEIYEDGKWRGLKTHWDTLRPAPTPPTKLPNFLVRLWSRLFGRKLPVARLVKG